MAKSIEEAFNIAYYLEIVCDTQIRAVNYAKSLGRELNVISDEIAYKTSLKLQGQAERLFSYYNFEGHRQAYYEGKLF